MAETMPKEPVYSKERIKTAALDSPPEPAGTAEGAGAEKSEPSAGQAPTSEMAMLRDFAQFLKRTRRVWLTAAGAIFGLVAVVTLVNRVSDWARIAREARHEQAVASVTPDRLIARCGQALEDETKEVFPVVMRTMSYQPRGSEKAVLAFSRTAEEKSDWVFLSMKDESGARGYDTAEAKIAALPCLDSKK